MKFSQEPCIIQHSPKTQSKIIIYRPQIFLGRVGEISDTELVAYT